jgi:hypothetical protein
MLELDLLQRECTLFTPGRIVDRYFPQAAASPQ